jgi:Abnormal spindle-like microcephaly-assoc'd, ASPM-SPD-2-Hydin
VGIVVKPTAAGTLSNTASVSSNMTDGNPANNTATVSTTVMAGGAVTLSTTSLVLPGTPLNFTCLPRTVTVENSGSGPLSLTNIASSSAEFTETNNCPATLASGGSCTVTVVFHPAALGTRTGTLTITDNAPGSPQTVAMTGEGLPVCNLAADVRSLAVLRGTDSATFEIYHDAQCGQATGPDPLTLACVNAQPLECAFHPQVITIPEHSRLMVSGLKGVSGSSQVWDVTGTSATEHRTLELAVEFADFWFAASRKAITMPAGMTAHYALTVVPVNGAAGRLKLSCGGVPRGASCTITPSEVQLGSSPVQVQVAIATTSAGVGPLVSPENPPPAVPWRLPILLWLLWGLLVAATGLAIARKRAKLGLGVALLWMVAWAGCGGGGMSPVATGGPTPAGTYTVVVTGTLDATGSSVVVDPNAATLTHDIQLTLSVN